MTREDRKNQVIDYLAGKLTSKEFAEAITDYLEGGLTFTQWVRFQMHVGMCMRCRRYLRQMKLTIRTLGRLPETPVPPEVRDKLLRRLWHVKAKSS